MLVDTDVFIWYLRGYEKAATFLEDCQPVMLSVVTYMELVQGMRNKQELQVLRQTIQHWRWRVLPIDEIISNRAAIYVEEHFLSHSLRLADALIAATAVEQGLTLATANSKHYRMIKELVIKRFDPSPMLE